MHHGRPHSPGLTHSGLGRWHTLEGNGATALKTKTDPGSLMEIDSGGAGSLLRGLRTLWDRS